MGIEVSCLEIQSINTGIPLAPHSQTCVGKNVGNYSFGGSPHIRRCTYVDGHTCVDYIGLDIIIIVNIPPGCGLSG